MKPAKPVIAMMALLAIFLFSAGALAAEVSQGKTLSYDETAKTIKIEEFDTNFSDNHHYGQPTGIVGEYDLTKAKVGIPPEAGDMVRIAYELEGERKVALKVMNVSKQDLRKKR
ncbi:MAG TPA: hypothetical protein ENF48_02875 [Desulfobacteraceae bacterium]|nr:hypothetical protein [Deltaproteobacteria bacterium]MBW2355481.1 hypothetical protein [Deltaproteobacteria bacterium]RLB99103.1 MAG: hypothetical protein DRH76_00795 [Deltaproteobacteria bacterium]HDI59294.1 hypothetical protein [Desulfobacteraceae bacterium]